jgi:hypothetical protein
MRCQRCQQIVNWKLKKGLLEISTKNYGALFFCTATYVRSAHIGSFWEMNPLLIAPVKNLTVSYMCSCDVFVPWATKHSKDPFLTTIRQQHELTTFIRLVSQPQNRKDGQDKNDPFPKMEQQQHSTQDACSRFA